MTVMPARAIRVRGRGQVTIPGDVRKDLELDEAPFLNLIRVGDCLILTPRRLQRASLAKAAQKAMKDGGLSLEDVLEELRGQRRRYDRDRHGL